MMQKHKGTHGTTMLSAKSILSNGFDFGRAAAGRVGKGLYFWEYFDDPLFANEYAIAWYQSQKRRGVYKEKDSICAVIDASFEVCTDDTVDCTGRMQERVGIMLRKLSERTDDDIGDAYESIITKIEVKRGKRFLLAKAIVSPPPKMFFLEKQVIPHPSVLVVRDESVKLELKIVETEE